MKQNHFATDRLIQERPHMVGINGIALKDYKDGICMQCKEPFGNRKLALYRTDTNRHDVSPTVSVVHVTCYDDFWQADKDRVRHEIADKERREQERREQERRDRKLVRGDDAKEWATGVVRDDQSSRNDKWLAYAVVSALRTIRGWEEVRNKFTKDLNESGSNPLNTFHWGMDIINRAAEYEVALWLMDCWHSGESSETIRAFVRQEISRSIPTNPMSRSTSVGSNLTDDAKLAALGRLEQGNIWC